MGCVRSRVWLAALAAGLVLGALPGLWAGASASETGKQLYVKHGCWQCHGFAGHGGVAGPALVPNVMPLEAMNNFVRNSARSMPPYREAILSDADLGEIHAYLVSIPKPADYKSVPLLNQ
jgi:mono/diheme cytochrome c family protein